MKKLFFLLFLLPHLAYGQAIPATTNTWYSIPSTSIKNNGPCPPNGFGGSPYAFFDNCIYVTIAWNSGAVDPDKSYHYFWGGGHTDYSGNETYRLDLTTLTVSRVNDPSLPVASGSSPDAIGAPPAANSRHTYDGEVWVNHLHKMFIAGGSLATGGNFAHTAWTHDPVTNVWTRISSDLTTSAGGMTLIGTPVTTTDAIYSTCYNPSDKTVYLFDRVNLYSINLDASPPVMRSLTSRGTGVQFYTSLMCDPKRKKVVLIGGGDNTFGAFDISGGPTTQVPVVGGVQLQSHSSAATTAGAGNLIGTSAPALVYDGKLDRWVGWGTSAEPNTIFVFDPDKALANDTSMLQKITTTGGPNPIIQNAQNGINKRFQLVPKLGIYTYCGDVNTNCWALRLYAPDNTLTVKDKSGSTQTNRPVTIGRPFRQGDIPNCPTAYISGSPVTTQTDVKNRWPDGSVKFGLVSFVIPSIAANGTVTVTLLNGSTCNNTGGISNTTALGAPYDFNVVMTLAGATTKTASARTMLNAGAYRLWGDGAVMTDFIIEDRSATRVYDMDPNNDGARAMHPIFDCRFYQIGNQVECSATLENAWVSSTQANSTRDETFTYSLTKGNASPTATAVNWAGQTAETFSTHPFTGMSRAHKVFWASNTPGAVLVDHNLAYLASTGLVENFDYTITENATQVAARKTAWTNATKTLQGAFNGTTDPIGNYERRGSDSGGGHPWVGLHNTWDVQYLYNMGGYDQTMEDLFYGNADLFARNQMHNRELDNPAGRGLYYDAAYSTAHTSPLGRPVSIAARKELTTLDYSDSCGGTIGADKINTGTVTTEWTSYSGRYAPHHAPQPAHLQYLLSGRYFYMEEVQFQAAYFTGWAHGCVDNATSPGSSRQGDKGYIVYPFTNEVRGYGWSIRDMIYAWVVSPDGSPEKDYFAWYTSQNRELVEGTSNVPNQDPVHLAAWQYGNNFKKPSFGGSPIGELVAWAPDNGPGTLREDGTPPRNAQDCLNAGFTCAISPWQENFIGASWGMGNDAGLDFTNLLNFRALYLFGTVTGVAAPAFAASFVMPGKVELQYAGLPPGQGWWPNWDSVLQYAQPVTRFTTGQGSDQHYEYIFLGAMSFLGNSSAYSLDGGTAYSRLLTDMNNDFVAQGSSYIANVNGSISSSDPDLNSCKWCILPRTSYSAVITAPPPPPVPTAPGPPVVTILP